jgi:hypothetical protein
VLHPILHVVRSGRPQLSSSLFLRVVRAAFFFLVQARLSPGAAPCMHEQCGYAAACSRAASTAMANVCMEVQFPSTPTVVAAAVDQ